MKIFFKRIMITILATILCMASAIPAFAAENENLKTSCYVFEVSEDGKTDLVRSSVSGYNQKTVTTGANNGISIDCNGSGYGGMGITIETSCAQGSVNMNFAGSSVIGWASSISGSINTNGRVELNRNLNQDNLGRYFIAFDVPDGYSVFVKVWIYG